MTTRTGLRQSLNPIGLFVAIAALVAAALVVTPALTAHAVDPLTDLGTLGGSYSFAHDVNSSGLIVGEAAIASGDSHAFSYTPEPAP